MLPLCRPTVLAVRAWLPWRSPKTYTYDGVMVRELLVPPIPWWIGKVGIKQMLERLSGAFLARQIATAAKGADLIHSVAIGPHAFAAQNVAEQRGIPHFVQLIGGDVTCLDQSVARSVSFQTHAKKITGFISNSRSLAKTLEHVTGLSLPIETIYRGVDTTVFQEARADQKSSRRPDCTFLYLGGYVGRQFDRQGSDQKGADVLLRAWLQVERKMKVPATLLVGGPNIDTEGFRRFRSSLAHPDRVACLGALAAKEIPKLLQGIDVLVLPSRKEGMPNVCLEAMASGVPIVAAAVGGVSELIRAGTDGVLVSPEDSDQLADAMLDLIRSPDLRKQMGIYARATIEESFDSRKYGNQLMECYWRGLEKFPPISYRTGSHEKINTTRPRGLVRGKIK
jgi:glycosyltransferase involved in cell wall biosynthesis